MGGARYANATGARIRAFPATPDKLLATLEALDA
jgi:CO/xanthine dehydrogenase Mo-binding subunit